MSPPNSAKYCGNPILSVWPGWNCFCVLVCSYNKGKLFLVKRYVSACLVKRGSEASPCQLSKKGPLYVLPISEVLCVFCSMPSLPSPPLQNQILYAEL